MSSASAAIPDLLAAGDAEALPGYILSPPRLREWADAEAWVQRTYLAAARELAAGLAEPPDAALGLLREALETVRRGDLTFGMPGFDGMIRSARGFGLMLWLSLRIKHPQVTPEQADALAAQAPRQAVLQNAVYDLWGYGPNWAPPAMPAMTPPGEQQPAVAASTGAASSDSSVASAA